MKKVFVILLSVLTVISVCTLNSFATFDKGTWVDDTAVSEKYNQTKYSESFQEQDDIPCQTFWFSGTDSYIAQRIELFYPADVISFGCGGSGKLNISVFEYDNCVADSIENTPIDSAEVDVIHSGWRTGIPLKETLPAGTYVILLKTTTPGQFWLAASPYLEEMRPENNEIVFETETDSAVDLVSCAISFRTYISKAARSLFVENTVIDIEDGLFVSAIGAEKDWVGIYKKGENADASSGGVPSIYWSYVSEMPNGSINLKNAHNNFDKRADSADFENGLPAGEYTISLFSNDSYEVLKSVDIVIKQSTPAPTKAPVTPSPSPVADSTSSDVSGYATQANESYQDDAKGSLDNSFIIIIVIAICSVAILAIVIIVIKKKK